MMGTKLTQMHLHGEVAELHPFALNTVAICWPSPATHERIDEALVFLAHPGNWLAGPQTPFSITHNLTVPRRLAGGHSPMVISCELKRAL